MLNSVWCNAIRAHNCLELQYDGFSRVVEVHAVGVSKDGIEIARVWQTRGGSNSNESTGWQLLRLDEASSADVINEKSEAPRPGYKRGDPAMSRISFQV